MARNAVSARWLAMLLVLGVFSYTLLLILWSSTSENSLHSDVQLRDSTDPVKPLPMGNAKHRNLRCVSWRATQACSPFGPREPGRDIPCGRTIYNSNSGFCELEDTDTGERFQVMLRYCDSLQRSTRFSCNDAVSFVDFRVDAQRLVEKALVPGFALPNVQTDAPPRDGIVIVVYPKMIASAYAMIRALHDEMRCDLEIELWYCPQELYAFPGPLKPLHQLAESDDKISFHKIKDGRAMGFGAKVFSIFHSSFDRVLFLDADNIPVRDPNFLFKSQEFEDTGALFWPDYWHPKRTIFNIQETSMLWELLDMPFVDMFEQESGQLLIDRRRHAAPIRLAFFYMFSQPNLFSKLKVAHGDKDLFRFAWLKLKAPFHMIKTPPAVAGKVVNGSFCGMTMVQHDMEGQLLFLHRNQFKLTGRIAGFKKREAPEADSLPDPIIWTHLLSFRNTSSTDDYIIESYGAEPEFPKGQHCYGKRLLGKDPHFVSREINDVKIARLEDMLRRFAFDAAQVQKQEHDKRG